MSEDPLQKAIAAVGSPDDFRHAVGISVRTLASWKKHGVPDVRWVAVASASSGLVSVQDLALDRARRVTLGNTIEVPIATADEAKSA